MPYPSRISDADELSAVFEDHREVVYLGQWKVLTVGNVRLVRRDEGAIDVEVLEEDCLSL